MMFVSDGAMSLSSNNGRHVVPKFVDFQMPPAAVETNSVFDGAGMPCTSETRPMKFDGPTFRHRNTETIEESSTCAEAWAPKAIAVAAPTTAVSKRDGCIRILLCG